MILRLDEISRLYQIHGSVARAGETITQLQQALRCADLAERSGASCEIITAALLHDFGTLLAASAEGNASEMNDGHQYAAIPFLRGLFPDAVIEPIRLHTDAKRYLCAMDSGYWSNLSPAARYSLGLQGGPLLASEAARFVMRPYAVEAIAIRRWKDLARNGDAKPPGWSHFLPLVQRAESRALELAA